MSADPKVPSDASGTSRSMTVGALQMVSTPIVAENLDQAGVLLAEARDRGVELALLPEYFCILGMRDADKVGVAEAPGSGPIQDFLSKQSEALGMWIIGGTLPLKTHESARVTNTTLVFDPSGRQIGRAHV